MRCALFVNLGYKFVYGGVFLFCNLPQSVVKFIFERDAGCMAVSDDNRKFFHIYFFLKLSKEMICAVSPETFLSGSISSKV